MKEKSTTTLNVRLPVEKHTQIKTFAAMNRLSIAEIVIQATDAWMLKTNAGVASSAR